MWRIFWSPKCIPIYIQQDETLHSLFISGNCSTCFRWYFHTSSGALTTVSIASGICHTVTAICRYRGRVGTGLSVLWVTYATHINPQHPPNEMLSGTQPRWNANISRHFTDRPRSDHQGFTKPATIPRRLGRCQSQKCERILTFRRCRLPESMSLNSLALKASRYIYMTYKKLKFHWYTSHSHTHTTQ
jgi:hypothetical protein